MFEHAGLAEALCVDVVCRVVVVLDLAAVGAAALVVDVSAAVETASALPMSRPRPVASLVDVGGVPGSLLVVGASLVFLVLVVVSTAVRVLIVVRLIVSLVSDVLIVVRLIVSLVSDAVVEVMLAVVFETVVVRLAVVLVWVTVDSVLVWVTVESVTELDEYVTDAVLLVEFSWADLDDLSSAFRVLVVVERLVLLVGALVLVEVVLAVPLARVVALLLFGLVSAACVVELGGDVATLDLEADADVVPLVAFSWAGLDDACSLFRVLVVVEMLVLPVDALVTVGLVLNVLLVRVVLLLSEIFVRAPMREVDENAAEVVSEVVLVELREEVIRADEVVAGASVVLVREAVVVWASGSLVAASC